MSAGTGVTYELEFKFTDKGTLNFLKKLNQEAEKIAKSLDKISLKNLSKQAENLKKVMSNNNDVMKQQVKIAKQATDTMVNGAKKYREATEQSMKSVQKMNDLLEKRDKVERKRNNNTSGGSNSFMGRVRNIGGKIARNIKENAISMLTNEAMKSFEEFQESDFEVRSAAAKTGGFDKDYKKFMELARKVGGATKFSNFDIAQAINSGATLGIKTNEMEKYVTASSNLAQAFNSDLMPTLEMIKIHMNSYQLKAEDVDKVTDMIAVTAKNTSADLSRLSEGFKYVGASGQALQVPLETVYAMLGKLNDLGLQGSTAGTGLNQMFESLKDFKKRSKLEQVIGKITDKKGNLIDVVTIMERLQTQTSKMGNADKTGILKSIFGVQGGRAVNALLNGSIDSLKDLQKEIKKSKGATSKLANYMMKGSGGAIETMFGTLSSFFSSVFQNLEPILVPIVGAFTGLLDVLMKISEKAPELAQISAILASFAVGVYVFAILQENFRKLRTAMTLARTSLSGWKLGVLIYLAVIVVFLYSKFKKWLDKVKENEKASEQWEITLKLLGYTVSNLIDLIVSFVNALLGVETGQDDTKESTEQMTGNLKQLNKTIFELTVNIQNARRWVEEHQETIRKWGTRIFILLGIIKMLQGLITTFKLGAIAVNLLNGAFTLLTTNPVVLWITVIVIALIGLEFWLVHLYKTNEEFRNIVDIVWSFVKKHIVDMILAAISPFALIISKIVELYNTNENFKKIVDETWNFFQNIVKGAVDTAISWIDKGIGALGRWIDKLKKAQDEVKQNPELKIQKNIAVGRAFTPSLPIYQSASLGNLQKHAVGTDNFQSSGRGGMTTVDEHGDEAIWLPNGSMVARNTTTRDILSQMKGINKNTKGGSSASSTTINNNHFEINIASGGRDGAFEFVSELKRLGFE